MDLKFVWPGRTRTPGLRALQEFHLERIRPMMASRVIESREARGMDERAAEKIKEIEAQGLEKHLDNDYIICLVDDGKQMSSEEFARFLERCQLGPCRSLAFVVGGFLGLASRILDLADLRLSLSRMTFSHELARVVLLEQVYRCLTMVKGKHYAK